MTPEQIAQTAQQIAGDRAIHTAQSQMNMTITCADAGTANPHRNNANIVVVLLRPRQQIVIRKSERNYHIGRFNGDRGER